MVTRPSRERETLGSNPSYMVESCQGRKHWYPCSYPLRSLAVGGQCWDWLVRCQYTVTGWDRKFELQLVSHSGHTYKCLIAVPSLRYSSILLGR